MEKTYGGRTERDYMTLWSMFVNKTEKLIYKANDNKKLPLILWSSHLTKKDYLTDFLDPKKYIIQIWTTTKDEDLANIVKSGFKTIFSTYDTLYLDCGYGNWLTTVSYYKKSIMMGKYTQLNGLQCVKTK